MYLGPITWSVFWLRHLVNTCDVSTMRCIAQALFLEVATAVVLLTGQAAAVCQPAETMHKKTEMLRSSIECSWR